MKSLSIDFAPNSLARTLCRIDAFTWLAASIGLLGCIVLVGESILLLQDHAASRVAFEQVVNQQRRRVTSAPVQQKKNIPAAEAIAVNGAISQLNLPWRDVLDAIERATPADIALLSLEPDAAKHSAKGSAEAKDSAAMIGYIESLRQQDFFHDVDLLHHEINETDPHKPLRFQFEVGWQKDGS